MNRMRNVATILFVISFVSAARNQQGQSNGQGQQVTGQQFYSLFGQEYKLSSEDTVEVRYQKLQTLVVKQQKVLEKSDEEMSKSQETFDTVCNKDRMTTVTTWADEYFAKYYLKSSASSLETSKVLYNSLKDHVESLSLYKEEIDKYTKEVFEEFSKIFFVVRQQNMILFFNVVCGFAIKYNELPASKNAKVSTFYSLVKTSAWDIKLLFDTAPNFFAEMHIVYNKMIEDGKDKRVEFDIAWYGTGAGKKPIEMYYHSLYLVSQDTCTAVINAVYLALGDKRMESTMTALGLKDAKRTADKQSAFTHLTSFFDTYYKIFFKPLDNDGKPNAKYGWPIYLSSCIDQFGTRFKTQQDLIIKIKLGVESSVVFAKEFRGFFSNRLYTKIDADNNNLKPILFDELLFLGLGNDQLSYEDLAYYADINYQLHYNFFADFMVIGVEGSTVFTPEPNQFYTYNYLVSIMADRTSTDQKKVIAYKTAASWITLLESIYRVYSYIRSDGSGFTHANGIEAAKIYEDIYKFLIKKTNLDKLVTGQYPFVAKSTLTMYWSSMVTYCCYKFTKDGNCNMEENDFNQISQEYQISYQILITRVTILTIIVTLRNKQLEKAHFELIKTELTKMGWDKVIVSCNGKPFSLACVTKEKFTVWHTFVITYFSTKGKYASLIKITLRAINEWIGDKINGDTKEVQYQFLFHFLWSYWVYNIRRTKEVLDSPDLVEHLIGIFAYRIKTLPEPQKGEALLSIMVQMTTVKIEGSAEYALDFAMVDTKEIEFVWSVLFYMVYMPATRLYKEKNDAARSKLLTTRLSMVMAYFQKVYGNEMTALGLKDMKSWAEKYNTIATKWSAWELIDTLMRIEALANVSSFFVTYSMLGGEVALDKRSEFRGQYQNPVIVLLNFFNLSYMTSQSYFGLPEDFYEAIWVELDRCAEKNYNFNNDKPLGIDECPWSYRKYAELYFLVKYDYQERQSRDTGTPTTMFHTKGNILVHHRIFLALAYSTPRLMSAMCSLCGIDEAELTKAQGFKTGQTQVTSNNKDKESDLCIVWSMLATFYPQVTASTSNPMTPAQLYNKIAIILGMSSQSTHITLSNRFNLLALADAMDYFVAGEVKNYDRFIDWIDANKIIMTTESNYKDGGLALRKDLIWDLPLADDSSIGYKASEAKAELINYLRMNFFKSTYSGAEVFSRTATEKVLLKEDLMVKIVSYASIVNFFALKTLLIFSRTESEFAIVAKVIMGRNRFLLIPNINSREYDGHVALVIAAVACDDMDRDAKDWPFKYTPGVISGKCSKTTPTAVKDASILIKRMSEIMDLIFTGTATKATAEFLAKNHGDQNSQMPSGSDQFKSRDLLLKGAQLEIQRQIQDNEEKNKIIKQSSTTQINTVIQQDSQEDEYIEIKTTYRVKMQSGNTSDQIMNKINGQLDQLGVQYSVQQTSQKSGSISQSNYFSTQQGKSVMLSSKSTSNMAGSTLAKLAEDKAKLASNNVQRLARRVRV